MPGHILVRMVLIVAAAMLTGATAVLLLGDDLRPDGTDAESEAAASPAEPAIAAQPAPLTAPVTRVATDASAPDALAIVERAHTAVITAPGPDRLPAAHLAHHLRAPLVVTAGVVDQSTEASDRPSDDPTARSSSQPRPDAAAELRRMGVVRAVLVGDAVTEDVPRAGGVREIVELQPSSARHPSGRQLLRWAADDRDPGPPDDPGFDETVVQDLADSLPAPAEPTSVAALVRPRGAEALRVALAARAVGHTVVVTGARDLRGDADLIDRVAGLSPNAEPPPVIIGGRGMAALDRGDVGLYGVPSSAALGALGEQPVEESVARTRRIAREYQQAVDDADIIGCFEIIATIASASAGRDGNYSNELPISDLEPAVRAARRAGMYVLLDLQPGRTDFLTQAKRYRRLLRRPHVGLALDPEWRLRPDEKHLEQIGSVGIDEVNEVADWLADLTRRRRLPQKMLLIHQFRLSMVRDRELLDTSHDELAYVIQMDGQGPQGSKIDTWQAITTAPPDRVQFGWKNFYDEDTPVRSPEATMALTPPPVFVSYQ